MSLSGEDKFGKDSNNYTKYGATEHLGGEVTANSASGRIGDLNLTGSAFIGGDTQGLKIGKVNVESAVNSYDLESKQTSKNTVSKSSTYIKSHQEENVAGNLQLSGARIEGNLTGIGSNIDLGENTFVGGKLTTDSRELHNSFYEKNTSRGFSAGISHGTASLNYGKSSSTYDEKDTINAKSNLRIGDGSVLNNGAEITATNFEYGNIQINNGDVKYGARIDTRDVKTTSRSSNFGVSIGINSPIKDRVEQAAGAVKQVRRGDTIGGLVAGVNAGTGMVSGLAGNQGTRQAYHTGNLSQSEVRNASANNNFYANIGVNAGYSTSKNSNNSHNESAVVTTMKPMNENSSITYNNVNNITYQGTQAQGGTFIYNNVKNIRKEAVELHNSSSSRSSNFGISTGATIGYGYGTQITGNGGSVSASRSNLNTTETVYQNGNFQNVNEVHNNTGTMTLSGFNQEGGKVTGNIGKLVVESRQNTSTTTGRSSGASVGISANGVPSSLNANGSRTSGSRAFVDNQSSFIVGEGSNLHVGTVENTGAIIGKQSENGTTFKIDKYVGHDIQNYDTMTTTGISVGTSLGKSPRVTNIGFNQETGDKQGVTRNTVVGNVEIGKASGSPINRDVTKANEVTKDVHHSTNVNVESQTIEYATNPGKLKEDLNKAKDEIKDVTKALDNSIHDPGDDNRNFFGQLRETRLSETVENIAGERLKVASTQNEIKSAFEEAYSDLGYKAEIKFSTPEETPELKDKAGTAYVSSTGVHTMIININAKENSTKSGLIGTISEEGSHIINGVEGRQIETGTEEKGLESTGRATNSYFQDKYKDDKTTISMKSDGAIDTSKLGTHVGDSYYIHTKDSINAQSGSVVGFNDNELQIVKKALDNKTGYKITFEKTKEKDKEGDLKIKIIGTKPGIQLDEIDEQFKYIVNSEQSVILGKGKETVTGIPSEVYDYMISFSLDNNGKYRYNTEKGYSEIIKYDSLTEATISLGHEENHVYRYMKDGFDNEKYKGIGYAELEFKPDAFTRQKYNLQKNKIYKGIIIIPEDEYDAIQFENKLSKKLGKPMERRIYDVNVPYDDAKKYIREVK